MAKSTRARHIILIVGLGLSLAPVTFAAGAHTLKSRGQGDAFVQGKRLRDSQGLTWTDQAEARPNLIIVQAPEMRPGPLSRRFPQGSRLVRLPPSEHSAHCLTLEFFTAADPRTSFDGARVLFAGKKTADSLWQIWEMNADGSGARQITHCSDDCLKPAYLPHGQIVFTALPAERGGARMVKKRERIHVSELTFQILLLQCLLQNSNRTRTFENSEPDTGSAAGAPLLENSKCVRRGSTASAAAGA
jgi:hypothetical protein